LCKLDATWNFFDASTQVVLPELEGPVD
jgi:hypothetical protein